ncbi:hypothetical protein M9H77_00058 [Catharanthus roseus]|nr:hypothetical protein M9H77_00058 [Catharanthus roseus]
MASTMRKRSRNLSPNPSPSLKSSSALLPENFIPEPPPKFLPSSKTELLRLVAVVGIAASVAVVCNFFVKFYNQQPIPFCDSGSDIEDFLDVPIASDNCEPCPSNGICSEGKLECARGYVKHGRLCIEDRDINAAEKTLVRKDELWTYLDKHKVMENHGLDEITYMHAKLRAIEASRKLLKTRINAGRFEEFNCPELLVKQYKPISCCIRQWIVKHALVLVPLCALLLGCIVITLKVRRRHNLSVRAEELYNQICDILEENALRSRGVNGDGEVWVVASWLRDYVLTPKERKDPFLWEKDGMMWINPLEMPIHLHFLIYSRLDRYPKMIKGESKVVWEWQVEGSISSSGKIKNAEKTKWNSGGTMNSTANQQHWEPKDAERLHG